MKIFCYFALFACLALDTFAAPPEKEKAAAPAVVPPAKPAQTTQAIQSESIPATALPTSVIVVTPMKPNEIKRRQVTYSGIAVQVVKTRNPLQMINPFAPKEYGSGFDNASRDVTTGTVTGLNVFSVKF